jgi:hypothetical protein
LQRSENLRFAKAVKPLAFPSNARNVALIMVMIVMIVLCGLQRTMQVAKEQCNVHCCHLNFQRYILVNGNRKAFCSSKIGSEHEIQHVSVHKSLSASTQ